MCSFKYFCKVSYVDVVLKTSFYSKKQYVAILHCFHLWTMGRHCLFLRMDSLNLNLFGKI